MQGLTYCYYSVSSIDQQSNNHGMFSQVCHGDTLKIERNYTYFLGYVKLTAIKVTQKSLHHKALDCFILIFGTDVGLNIK